MKTIMLPLLLVALALLGCAPVEANPAAMAAEDQLAAQIAELTMQRDAVATQRDALKERMEALALEVQQKDARIAELSDRLALETAARIAAQQAAIDAEAARKTAEAEAELAQKLAAEEAARRAKAERLAREAELERQLMVETAAEAAARHAAAQQAAAEAAKKAAMAEKRRQLFEEGRTIEMAANEARARGFMALNVGHVVPDDTVVPVTFWMNPKSENMDTAYDVHGSVVGQYELWPWHVWESSNLHKDVSWDEYCARFGELNNLSPGWCTNGVDKRLSAESTWRFPGPELTFEELVDRVNMDVTKPMEENSITVVPRPKHVAKQPQAKRAAPAPGKQASRSYRGNTSSKRVTLSADDMLQVLSPEQVKGVLGQVTSKPVSWDQVSVDVKAKTISVNGKPVNGGQPVAPNVLAAAAKGVAAQHNASPQG